jgi:hypothetical protein
VDSDPNLLRKEIQDQKRVMVAEAEAKMRRREQRAQEARTIEEGVAKLNARGYQQGDRFLVILQSGEPIECLLDLRPLHGMGIFPKMVETDDKGSLPGEDWLAEKIVKHQDKLKASVLRAD